jgi:hypothetical protein
MAKYDSRFDDNEDYGNGKKKFKHRQHQANQRRDKQRFQSGNPSDFRTDEDENDYRQAS